MEWAAQAGSLITLVLGVFGVTAPLRISKLVGISPIGNHGLSEVRATYGGFFVGLGVMCLWLQQPQVYLVAGVAWMCAATVRVLSIMIDKAALPNNFGGVFIEGGVGALLLLGAVSN